MPAEGLPLVPKRDILSFEAITRIVRVAVSMGIDRIRITGGEPLLRRDLPVLLEMLKRDAGVSELALTTNALLLDRHVDRLRRAGLDRLNISLDALDPRRFESLTRFSKLQQAWHGIEAAVDAGYGPLRINAVIIAGENDDEFDAWVQLTRERNIIVRLLELMPIGEGAALFQKGGYANLTHARHSIAAKHGLEPARVATGNGPARYWRVPGSPGMLGFITPMSDPYCDTCSRFRLTSTGGVRPCLAYDLEVDVADAARAGDDAGIREGFIQAAMIKPAGHRWSRGQITQAGMSQLG